MTKIIKVKILKENKLDEMCGGEPHMQEPQPEPVMGPVIGIGVDDEPCECPDMAHNHDNDEGSMARSQLMHMRNYAEELTQMISDHDNLPEWVELKITLANDYIAKVKHYLEGESAREQGMLENMGRSSDAPLLSQILMKLGWKLVNRVQGLKDRLNSKFKVIDNKNIQIQDKGDGSVLTYSMLDNGKDIENVTRELESKGYVNKEIKLIHSWGS